MGCKLKNVSEVFMDICHVRVYILEKYFKLQSTASLVMVVIFVVEKVESVFSLFHPMSSQQAIGWEKNQRKTYIH